jgi:protein-S-isoprenylcysteine O-methyltransferase Ste14
MQHVLTKLGRLLYRYRAVIAVPFFTVLVFLSRPLPTPWTGCILLCGGLGMRMWAAGYLGTRGRTRSFLTDYRIINGPYRVFKHPLYIGNFLLVFGVVVLFRPPLWYAVVIIVSFIVVYSLIASSEAFYLRERPKKRVTYKLVNLRGEVWTITVVCVIYALYAVLRYMQ